MTLSIKETLRKQLYDRWNTGGKLPTQKNAAWRKLQNLKASKAKARELIKNYEGKIKRLGVETSNAHKAIAHLADEILEIDGDIRLYKAVARGNEEVDDS